MTDDAALLELRREHQAAKDKYTYFLLAVAASAVAFAVQKTSGLRLSYWLLPVGIAAACWGVSFFFGCKNLVWVQSAVYANFNLLSLRRGVHPDQPQHPQEAEAAVSGVKSALHANSDRARFYAVWQFRSLIVGALFFILWHVLEMYRFTHGL